MDDLRALVADPAVVLETNRSLHDGKVHRRSPGI
jgi:hypothetical protein